MDLHIPTGINFECTGCGNCCLRWPVPLTSSDYQRISKLQMEAGELSLASKQLFRPLRNEDIKLRTFTHTLEKRADGKCEFLTEDNRCYLHAEYGAQAKPSMCQLFPYTFNPTPSGVYASVSFASTGVLLNSGRALAEQAELLQSKYEQFCELFSHVLADWSQTQLIDGVKLDWSRYMELDGELLAIVCLESPKRIERRLQLCSRYLVGELPAGTNVEMSPNMEARPKTVDQLLLKYLHEFYFPSDVFNANTTDVATRSLLKDLVQPPLAVRQTHSGKQFGVQQLLSFTLGDLDEQSQDLLFRFIYCRMFAKLYFGFGFANLSVLVGIHHLAIIVALLRIEIKMRCLAENRKILDFLEILELVRNLERRLTQAVLSKETAAVLETLLTSPARLDRILSLAS